MEEQMKNVAITHILCTFALVIALAIIGHCVEKASEATKAQTIEIVAQTKAITSQSIIQADSSEAFRKTFEAGADKIKGAIDTLNSTIHNK